MTTIAPTMMAATGTGAALLAGILEHPGDDGRRLVFADWLEDAGDPARAEFVRVSVQQSEWFEKPVEGFQWWAEEHRRRYEHVRDWIDTAGDEELSALTVPGWKGDKPACYFWNRILPRHRVKVRWMRGFIHLVRCSLAAWMEPAIGPGLAGANPLDRVVLKDVAPLRLATDRGPVWVWTVGDGGAGKLPRPLFDALPAKEASEAVLGGELPAVVYGSEGAAKNDLSAGCIIWGRSPDAVGQAA